MNQFEQRFSRYDLGVLKRSVDLRKSDDLTKNDFSLAMLLRLGKIKPKDLEKIEEVFFKLDMDKSGVLDQDDVTMLLERGERIRSGSPTVGGPGGDRDRDVFESDLGVGEDGYDGGGKELNAQIDQMQADLGMRADLVESTGNPLAKRTTSSDDT